MSGLQGVREGDEVIVRMRGGARMTRERVTAVRRVWLETECGRYRIEDGSSQGGFSRAQTVAAAEEARRRGDLERRLRAAGLEFRLGSRLRDQVSEEALGEIVRLAEEAGQAS